MKGIFAAAIFTACVSSYSSPSLSSELIFKDQVSLQESLQGLHDYFTVPGRSDVLTLANAPGSGLIDISYWRSNEAGYLVVANSLALPASVYSANKVALSPDGTRLLIETAESLILVRVNTDNMQLSLLQSKNLDEGTFSQLNRPLKALEWDAAGQFAVGLSAQGQVFALDLRDENTLAVSDVFEDEAYLTEYHPTSIAGVNASHRFLVGNSPDYLSIAQSGDGLNEPRSIYQGQDSGLGILTEFALSNDGKLSLIEHHLDGTEYVADSSSITSIVTNGGEAFVYDYGEGQLLVLNWGEEGIELKQLIEESISRGASPDVHHQLAVSQDLQLLAVSGWKNHADVYARQSSGEYTFSKQYTAPLDKVGRSCGDCLVQWGDQRKVMFLDDNRVIRQQSGIDGFKDQLTVMGISSGQNYSNKLRRSFSAVHGYASSGPVVLESASMALDDTSWVTEGIELLTTENDNFSARQNIFTLDPMGGGVNFVALIGNKLFFTEGDYLPSQHVMEFDGSDSIQDCRADSISDSQVYGNFAVSEEANRLYSLSLRDVPALYAYEVGGADCLTSVTSMTLTEVTTQPEDAEFSLYTWQNSALLVSLNLRKIWLYNLDSANKFALMDSIGLDFAEESESPIAVHKGNNALFVLTNNALYTYYLSEGRVASTRHSLSGNSIIEGGMSFSNSILALYFVEQKEAGEVHSSLQFMQVDDGGVKIISQLSDQQMKFLAPANLREMILREDRQQLLSLAKEGNALLMYDIAYPPYFTGKSTLILPTAQEISLDFNTLFMDVNMDDQITINAPDGLPNGLYLNDGVIQGAINMAGSFNFALQAKDVQGLHQTVNLTLKFVDVPAFQDLELPVTEDVPLSAVLVPEDALVEGVTLEVVTVPKHGALSGELPTITYVPTADFFGEDEFSFRVVTDAGEASSVNVILKVEGVNDAPIANPDTLNAISGQASTLDVLSNDVDVDGDDILLKSASGESGELVIVENKTIRFTPPSGFVGQIKIDYTISDGAMESQSTALINVQSEANTKSSGGGSFSWLLLYCLLGGTVFRKTTITQRKY